MVSMKMLTNTIQIKNHKILIVVNDKGADMLSNKKT